MRILVAEDDLASRKFLSKFLSQYGEVDVAIDGVEAVEQFGSQVEAGNFYDLVCLDIMMPKIDGYKALEVMREIEGNFEVPNEKRVKVILTSALNETESTLDIKASGYDGYAIKPIDMDKFTALMQKLGLLS
ncbi:MAG: response regulator [Lachnospiraceae bacterium]|nr:response regulator [Lachnospiraceae bacterium]